MKIAIITLATLFCLGSLNSQAQGTGPVTETYCMEAFVQYEDPNGRMSSGQWITDPSACGDKSDLQLLFSGMAFYKSYLPSKRFDRKTKTTTHVTKLRIVRNEIYLNGSVTITVIPVP